MSAPLANSYHVLRVLQALEALADAPCSTTQLAQALRIHGRTARRILKRLAYDGYARSGGGPRPKYVLTPQFAALATRALTNHTQHAPADPRHA